MGCNADDQRGCHANKNKMKLILLACCLWLLSVACKRNMCCGPDDELKEMVRTQTQCADPWGYGASNDETVTKLKDYLRKKILLPFRVELQPANIEFVCQACTCSKGFVFHGCRMRIQTA